MVSNNRAAAIPAYRRCDRGAWLRIGVVRHSWLPVASKQTMPAGSRVFVKLCASFAGIRLPELKAVG